MIIKFNIKNKLHVRPQGHVRFFHLKIDLIANGGSYYIQETKQSSSLKLTKIENLGLIKVV